jgi:hypothetical protein
MFDWSFVFTFYIIESLYTWNWFLVVIICLFTSTYIVSLPWLKNASTLCDSGGGGGGVKSAAILLLAHKEGIISKPPPGAEGRRKTTKNMSRFSVSRPITEPGTFRILSLRLLQWRQWHNHGDGQVWTAHSLCSLNALVKERTNIHCLFLKRQWKRNLK